MDAIAQFIAMPFDLTSEGLAAEQALTRLREGKLVGAAVLRP